MLYGYGPYNIQSSHGLGEIRHMVQKGMIIGENYRIEKLDRVTLEFLAMILNRDPQDRPTLDQLYSHKFILQNKLDKSKMTS